jgi:hypothetical protein
VIFAIRQYAAANGPEETARALDLVVALLGDGLTCDGSDEQIADATKHLADLKNRFGRKTEGDPK